MDKPAAVVVAKDPTEQLLANILASPKMWSNRWLLVVGAAISLILGATDPVAVIATIRSWPIHPVLYGPLIFVVGYVLRVWPQFGLFAKLLARSQQEVVARGAPILPGAAVPVSDPPAEVIPKVVERVGEFQDPDDEAERETLQALFPQMTPSAVDRTVSVMAAMRKRNAL